MIKSPCDSDNNYFPTSKWGLNVNKIRSVNNSAKRLNANPVQVPILVVKSSDDVTINASPLQVPYLRSEPNENQINWHSLGIPLKLDFSPKILKILKDLIETHGTLLVLFVSFLCTFFELYSWINAKKKS